MIATIAHELRSPLTSIKGFSATLVSRWDRFDDGQKLELVTAIYHDSERMSRIISEVLDLARLEADRLELNRTMCEVAPIAEEAISHLKTLPGASRIEVESSPEAIVFADARRLQHVLFNLLENAVRFSDDGRVSLVAAPSGDRVSISVTDSGSGIPPDRLEAIFLGPRGGTHDAVPQGTGLGLYLSRLLVEAHGGTIDVRSRLGEGSTFTVTMPAGRS